MSTIASPTGRGVPAEGSRCIRRPGPALTSTIDAALLLQRAADVAGHDVDAGDVQADARGRFDGAGGDLGVDLVGHVGGGAAGAEVGVAADQDHGAGRRDRLGRVALLGQHRQGDRRRAGSCSGRSRGRRRGAGPG